MSTVTRKSLIALLIVWLIAAAVTWAGSQGSAAYAGWPIFEICALLAFGIQWLAFVPAYIWQTERYYDLTGSLTYLSVVALALALTSTSDPRALLLAGLVVIWAARLGSFLFRRILHDGSDGRFDDIKPVFARFFLTWNLQGLWVLLTAACALAILTSAKPLPLGVVAVVGFIVWLVGFAIEVIADGQKKRFRADPANEGKFINVGLWSKSRHPNYFGEIVLWFGVAIIAFPALEGWQYVTLISPVFVALLLIKVSGIPMLEARSNKKWGDDPAYQAYKDNTPVLVPKLR